MINDLKKKEEAKPTKSLYKNSRRPVACVEGQSAPSKESPRAFLAHCILVKLDRNDDYIVLRWLQVACELLQLHFDQHHLYHNSK